MKMLEWYIVEGNNSNSDSHWFLWISREKTLIYKCCMMFYFLLRLWLVEKVTRQWMHLSEQINMCAKYLCNNLGNMGNSVWKSQFAGPLNELMATCFFPYTLKKFKWTGMTTLFWTDIYEGWGRRETKYCPTKLL